MNFSCGIKTDNNMLCWGWNTYLALLELVIRQTDGHPYLSLEIIHGFKCEANSYWSDTYHKSMCALTTDNDGAIAGDAMLMVRPVMIQHLNKIHL